MLETVQPRFDFEGQTYMLRPLTQERLQEAQLIRLPDGRLLLFNARNRLIQVEPVDIESSAEGLNDIEVIIDAALLDQQDVEYDLKDLIQEASSQDEDEEQVKVALMLSFISFKDREFSDAVLMLFNYFDEKGRTPRARKEAIELFRNFIAENGGQTLKVKSSV